MKKKHLFYSLALAAVFGACTQDDFVASVSNSETVSNDFGQYVGVPFEGDVNFTRTDDVQTRIGLDDDLNWTWVEGDQVGLVWLNSDAISSAIDSYNTTNETDDDVTGYITAYDAENGFCAYQAAIQSGSLTPMDGSYVWGLWPTNWKTFSNTRMTYDSNNWHMTDGNIYKGTYIAYFPYQADRQSTSKFTVTQDAEQKQNATTYASSEEAATTVSNHIISSVPGEGLVWISQNDGEATTDGQNSSFLYKLAAQDTESGTADVVNIRMRPFSNILDLRILVNAGTMDAAVANSIQIESVDLIASEETFATKASFDFSAWGSDNNNNGVYAEETQIDGPNYFTYDIRGVSSSTKYVEEDKVTTLTNSIQLPAANNGQQQRVQLMMLPMYQADKSSALALINPTYKVRINTDYGYIEIDELDENGWRYGTASSTGVVVNPGNLGSTTATVESRSDGSKNLNYVRTVIGQRATRYISFDASDLTFDYIPVCSTADLIEAITKYNNLGNTNGTLNVNVESADCSFDDLIWSETNELVSVNTQTLTDEYQQPEGTVDFGTADEAIQTFIKNGNTLTINSDSHIINIGGMSAIADNSDKLVLTSKVNVTGTLGIATDVTLEQGMDIDEGGTVIISDDAVASLWIGDTQTTGSNPTTSTWDGALYLYQDGTLTLGRYASVTNNGEVHVNGSFVLKGASALTNEGEVYLYANADVENASSSIAPTFTNNGTIYYVDIIKNFDSDINYTNNGDVVASIIGRELGNHGDNYLREANDFGANTLIIQNVVISSEWNNLSDLTNFENVQLNSVDWNLYNAIEVPNATVTVTGTVRLISNGRNAAIECDNFVLEANARLHVEVSENAGSSGNMTVTCDGVTMNNNTYLYGYDYFSCSADQPQFIGAGVHYVYDSDGELMFND